MSVHERVDRDERTAEIEKAGIIWAYNFLVFALLFDVMYRVWILHQDAWDLLALVVASGVVSWIYLARHRALSRDLAKAVVFAAVVAVIGTVVGALLG